MNPSGFRYLTVWNGVTDVTPAEWKCGYCNREVASNKGYLGSVRSGDACYLRICPRCLGPSFFAQDGDYVPGSLPGASVEHLPDDVSALFHEIQVAVAAGAPTAAVLACRKMLMHIAVEKKAADNESFVHYVEYLSDHHYLPPDGKGWVDYVRERGNEANHVIRMMSQEEGIALTGFVEALLKFVYEMPNRVPKVAAPSQPPE